jgi:hypothetical protein
MKDGGGAMNEGQLEHLARHFDEEIIAATKYKRAA